LELQEFKLLLDAHILILEERVPDGHLHRPDIHELPCCVLSTCEGMQFRNNLGFDWVAREVTRAEEAVRVQ